MLVLMSLISTFRFFPFSIALALEVEADCKWSEAKPYVPIIWVTWQVGFMTFTRHILILVLCSAISVILLFFSAWSLGETWGWVSMFSHGNPVNLGRLLLITVIATFAWVELATVAVGSCVSCMLVLGQLAHTLPDED